MLVMSRARSRVVHIYIADSRYLAGNSGSFKLPGHSSIGGVLHGGPKRSGKAALES